MAAVQCPGCNAHLSVKGLVNCPLCQAYLNPPHHRGAPPAAPTGCKAGTLEARGTPPLQWLAVVALTAAALAVIVMIASVAFPSAEKIRHRQVMSALTQCQRAVQSTAKYGEADQPPYTENHGSADEFYFAWPAGSFYFSNAFGARMKMSASCVGAVSTGTITQLTVNGKDFR